MRIAQMGCASQTLILYKDSTKCAIRVFVKKKAQKSMVVHKVGEGHAPYREAFPCLSLISPRMPMQRAGTPAMML